MQIKNYFLLLAVLLLAANSYGQVGIGTTNPSPKSMLEVSSTSDEGETYRGLMPPRVPNNTARNAINPEASDMGLLVFVESTQCLQMWSGTEWQNVKCITVPSTWPAIQNFETTAADFELPLYSATGGYYTSGNNTGGQPASSLFAGPFRGYGVSNGSAEVILGPIDVSSATNATFKLRLGGFSRNFVNGMETADTVIISIGTDGPEGSPPTWSSELLIRGTLNNYWGFDAIGAATTDYSTAQLTVTSVSGINGISYLEITGIPNSENLAIKIVMKNNHTDEIWVIDDAEIWGN